VVDVAVVVNVVNVVDAAVVVNVVVV